MSEFSECLKGLFDDTSLFTREEWLGYLFGGITVCHGDVCHDSKEEHRSEIIYWLTDEDLPSESNLWMIIAVLEGSDNIPPAPLERFHAMAARRATEISPLGKLMLPNVHEYIRRMAFVHPVHRQLARLTREEQEKLLEHLYPEKT